MLVAYDFPLLSLFLFMLWVGFVIIVILSVIWAFIDNFRRRDHSGWAKAGWALLILVIPLFGTLIYLVARPPDAALA